MVRELAPHDIAEHACTHLQAVIEWLRDRHGLTPVRGELDIKSVILTIDYDERLTAAAVADAARTFAGSAELTFQERSFTCRTDWQSAGVPQAMRPPLPPRRGLGRVLARLLGR